jgi:hypothetical protein
MSWLFIILIISLITCLINPIYGIDGNRTSSLRRLDSTCDLKAYSRWYNQQYFGVLASDAAFWMYQTQPQIVLSNGLAMGLAYSNCKRLFDSLTYYRAGRMGPITIQDSYKIMCRSYCLEMDQLHEDAMKASQCSCLELSTQQGDVAYTQDGDWCLQNSARMLCDIVGYCGVWNCRIGDYMCPRYEWNKKVIPLKGPGNCVRGSSLRQFSLSSSLFLVILSFFLLNLY